MEIPNYEPFYLRSIGEVRAEIARLGLDLTVDDDPSLLAQPIEVGGRTIQNRYCAQPISGRDSNSDGSPSSLTRSRYSGYATGAFGLIWVERTAAMLTQESRRLCLSPPTVSSFAAMLEEMRAAAIRQPIVVLQLASDDLTATISAARLAKEAGFDGVDIQCGRDSLPGTLAALRATVPGILLTTRLCAYEAVRGGFGVSINDYRKYDATGPVEYVRRLVDSGLHMLNLTSTSPSLLGTARGSRAFADFERGDEHPLFTIARQIELGRAFRASFPKLPLIGSGLSWLRQFAPHLASGAVRAGGIDVAGFGRAALACPDLPARMLTRGRVDAHSTCMVCFACSLLDESEREVGCVLRSPEVYGPVFREMRRFDADLLLAGAKRCHLCEAAPCSQKSPTQTDILSFMKAFREGREEDAYAVIRSRNPLPEMVSQTSPYWLEEEGACIERTLTGTPVPIQDLQYTVAWRARQRGGTAVLMPAACSDKTVAIIGGGPTGIAAATRLLELGHRVHIYETAQNLGGVPVRLLAKTRPIADPRAEIGALFRPAIAAGRLEIFFGKTLGENLFTSDLLGFYAAVLVAVGQWQELSLGPTDGVIGALDLLDRGLSIIPRRAAVLAGGDSAMDACSALEAWGVNDIYVVFGGPRSEMHWHMSETWFARPGIHAMMEWKPQGYERDSSNRLFGIRLRHSEHGIEIIQQVDLVVEAMGLEVSAAVRADLGTGSERLYTAGAMVNGGRSVGHCIAEGQARAETIHTKLSQ